MNDFKYCIDTDGKTTAISDGKEITLREAVGVMALSLYEKTIKCLNEKDATEKKRLEDEIIFQSKVLDSLSNAHLAAIHA